MARDAVREIDLNKLLRYELSPVPIAIADTTGNQRSTNMAVLRKHPEVDVSVETLSTKNLELSTIIHGQALVQATRKPAG